MLTRIEITLNSPSICAAPDEERGERGIPLFFFFFHITLSLFFHKIFFYVEQK